jgi:hypothetical protein
MESIKANAKYIGIIVGVLVLGILAAYYFRIGKRQDGSGKDEIDDIIGEESGLLGENGGARESNAGAHTLPEKTGQDEQNQSGKREGKSIDEIISGLKAIPLDGLSAPQKKIIVSKIRKLEEIQSSGYSESEKQVTEEREPVRTHELPAEGMSDEKSKSDGAEPLQLYNGKIIKSLEEMRSALSRMDSDTFNYHVNYEKNDFASWIKKSLKDRKLYSEMRKARSREEAFSIVKRALSGK